MNLISNGLATRIQSNIYYDITRLMQEYAVRIHIYALNQILIRMMVSRNVLEEYRSEFPFNSVRYIKKTVFKAYYRSDLLLLGLGCVCWIKLLVP
jgi:hypothetical protein